MVLLSHIILLPVEAGGLSVVLIVRYIYKKRIKKMKNGYNKYWAVNKIKKNIKR